MNKIYSLLCGLLLTTNLFSQINFSQVYEAHPKVPKGVLEAVAHSYTRMKVVDENTQASCMGMPLPYGIMGLFENGENYFNENGRLVAQLSGISIEQQKANPQDQIVAYAISFEKLMKLQKNPFLPQAKKIYNVLANLSEIPNSSWINRFAKDAQLFEIFSFLKNPEMAATYNFTVFNYDLKEVFGVENLKVLSGKRVNFTTEGIVNEHNQLYKPVASTKSTQYGPAIWTPAPTCNYSSRSGTAISAITIHTIQGTYAGAISWAQNCSASVSYHYVVRSSDGQITQMVDEADKAWHVGSENPYTIGYEHDGYVDNPAWYTEALYNASAALSVDITNSGYGIPPLRTYYGAASSGTNVLGSCTKIKGHQHYPNQTHTDPGINWNWEKYYRLINNNPAIQTYTTATGTFYDSGGAAGNYTDDERKLWLFQPTNATSVTLNFSSFNIESGYDKMFIYDGSTINAPLIGTYTGTTSPGVVTSTGGSLLVEFRSDCSTVAAGWAVNYTSTIVSTDNTAPTTAIASLSWQTDDFQVDFTDNDNVGVIGKYYLVADKNPTTTRWSSNGDFGFCNELFALDDSLWTDVTGNYQVSNGKFTFADVAQQNSNTYYELVQNANTAYMYEWNQTITSASTSQRAGLHFFCDNPTLPNRGNSYFVFFRETDQKVQIYRVDNDVFSMKTNDACVVTADVEYTYRVTFNPQSGWIKVYVGDLLVSQWQDIDPFQSGNSISLRTAGCDAEFDNVRVYKSRGSNSTVTVGPGQEMRYQSVGAVATGAVRSMAVDEIGNWSTGDSEIFLIDWTDPSLNTLNDGQTPTDIDTTYSTTLYANWSGIDGHSAVDHYEVAIGTLPQLNDILAWTDVSLNTTLTHVLSNPIYDQLYYVSLRIVNGAGLNSLFVSDGQRLVEVINDNTAPTTAIAPLSWQTNDFQVDFTDNDNVVVNGKYFLVADKNPTTTRWSSNGDFGFCYESFTLDDSLWTDVTGNYQVASGKFAFADVAQQNSNTYYELVQNASTEYMYEWNQTITSASTSQRAGLHFFCDNPTLPNRGNSYFVLFRETDQKVQIYRVDNDVYSMKTNDACVVTADVEYTYRVTFNPQSGWIKVYVGDMLVSQWQDSNPFQSGNSISLRTAGCDAEFDNVRVYKSRGSNSTVTVGPAQEMRYQSLGAVATGEVRSMAVDNSGNWSTGDSELFLIDWTEPTLNMLNDGQTLSDIDTTENTTLYANWSGTDAHSAVGHYEVAVGTLPLLNNVLDWTNVSLDTILTHVLSSPIYDQLYYVSLRIVNGAGLISLYISDGQRLVDYTGITEEDLIGLEVYPNPTADYFEIKGVTADMKVTVFDQAGRMILENVNAGKINVSSWANGLYKVVISKGSQFVVKQLLKN